MNAKAFNLDFKAFDFDFRASEAGFDFKAFGVIKREPDFKMVGFRITVA